MKILIPILLALFISNSANAESLEDVCKYYENKITVFYAVIESAIKIRNEELYNHNLEDADVSKVIIENHEKYLKEEAKTYHYLDCSDFR